MASLGQIFSVKALPTELSLVNQPHPTSYVQPPEVQLRDAMIRAGVTPPSQMVMDGKIHRYATGDKRGDKSGWYVAYSDGVPAGSFGCWRSLGEGAVAWRADIGHPLSYDEERAFAARQVQAKAMREAENARIKIEGARAAQERWENASSECAAHPYLVKKGFSWNPGWRMDVGGRLISPMFKDGEIVGTQSIGPEGDKQFDFGSTASGSWWHFGPVHGAADRVYIVEGVATGVSVCNATGKGIAVAYSAQNLPAVAKAVRETVGASCEIMIVADNDGIGKDGIIGGPGYAWAQKAAQAVQGCSVVLVPTIPGGPDKMDADDFVRAGGDLRGLLEDGDVTMTVDGSQAVIDALEAHPLAQFVAIDSQARAPKWIIPGLIESGVITISGARGVGKTTSILPLAMAAAGLHGEGYALGPKKPERWRHVVYIVEHVEQAQRIIAGLVHHSGMGIDPQAVVDRLHLVEAKRLDPKELVPVGALYRHKFARNVGGVEIPPLVVFDTKAAVLAMDNENDNSEASRAIAALKQDFAGLPCWIIGHVAKASFGSKDLKALSDRGAGAFEADTVQNLYLIEEEKQRYLALGKKRFETAIVECDITSHTAEVDAIDEWGDIEKTTLRWGTVSPRETEREKTAPVDSTDDGKAHEAKQAYQQAWIESGCETVALDGRQWPILSRSAFVTWMASEYGITEKTATNRLAPKGEMGSHLFGSQWAVNHTGGNIRAADAMWAQALIEMATNQAKNDPTKAAPNSVNSPLQAIPDQSSQLIDNDETDGSD